MTIVSEKNGPIFVKNKNKVWYIHDGKVCEVGPIINGVQHYINEYHGIHVHHNPKDGPLKNKINKAYIF
jgi:hypothetical protein